MSTLLEKQQQTAEEVYVFPVSFAQQRLWFLQQLEPESAAYNISKALRLAGEFDVEVFTKTLNEIIRRHETLRTTFTMTDGRPMQVISERHEPNVRLVDLSSLEKAQAEHDARELFTTEGHRPFNLKQGPLLRVAIVRLPAAEHVIMFTMHHIISDAWSVGVFVNEFTKLYRALLAREPSPLKELTIQYVDYAEWQRDYLQGEVLERQLGYWRKQLAGAAPVLELRTDKPRPHVLGNRGAKLSFTLGKSLLKGLKELAQREDATVFMTVLAAWQVLLSRYSGQTDISVGTPIANRNRAETEGLIGFFVNTLVLRTDLSGNPRFTELLRRVREVCLGAYAHQDVPFEMLVDELQPVRSLSHTPLFQVMLTFQTAAGESFALPGLRLKPFNARTRTAKFDLLLALKESPRGLTGKIEYNTELWEAGTISVMVAHLRTLVQSIGSNPEQRLSELQLLSSEERRRLLVDWNDTKAEFPATVCLHELFEQQAARTPHAVAVVHQGEQISYRELNERADALARGLRSFGVGPETRVGLLLERSIETVVAVMATLKAGGAYVPLDPKYPATRLQFMLEDSEASVLLTEPHLAELASQSRAEVVLIGDRHQVDYVQCVKPAPENLAYVIYTSGSTGVPKGVAITHRSAVAFVSWAQSCFRPESFAAVLGATSLSFDLSIFELFVTLCSGGRVVVVNDALDLPSVADEGVTLVNTVPSVMTELLRAGVVPETVQTVNLAGEFLSEQLARSIYEAQPALRELFNLYGPSEDTTYSTGAVVDRELSGRDPSLGRPIANSQLYILDRFWEPVPEGVRGEVYLGGEGLARGYLNRPDLTAEKFVPDPFSGMAGSRLYRSGDMVRWRAGELEFVGRADAQVKVRGYRVELGEIEAALRLRAEIVEACVVAREERGGHKRLVAYLVAAEEKRPQAEELRAFLRESLPEYMVPALFVTLEEWPLTPNGKIDRRALPAPEPVPGATRRAPSNATEETLARIWAEVLGQAEVGVTDNFFGLGGDSLLSMQVVVRGNRAGLRLVPRQLFEHQTIAELAAALSDLTTVATSQAVSSLEKRPDVTREVPLTPIQRWFFSQELERPQHWNQAVLLKTREQIDASVLERAVRVLTLRHEALRLRFRHENGEWKQYLLSSADWQAENVQPVSVIDLKQMDAQQNAALEGAAAEVQGSIDLAAGPLLRVVLFELAEGQRLLLASHHLVTDGVSWRVLLDEMRRAYEQAAAGSEIELGPLGASFVDWADRLVAYAGSEELKKHAAYWETIDLVDRDYRVPTGVIRGPNIESSQRQVSTRLNAENTRALLQEVPRVYSTQINDVLLTALGRVFSRWTGRRRVVVGLEGHGREPLGDARLDLSGALGWFTSLYPVVLDADWNATGEALKAVKEQLRAVPDKGVSYGVWKYLSARNGDKTSDRASEGEVSFNYLGQMDQVVSAAGPFVAATESSGARQYDDERRYFKLSVVGSVRGGELVVTWKYSRNLHDAKSIEGLAADYEDALRELIDHCLQVEAGGLTPSDFPLVSMTQQQLNKIVSKVARHGL